MAGMMKLCEPVPVHAVAYWIFLASSTDLTGEFLPTMVTGLTGVILPMGTNFEGSYLTFLGGQVDLIAGNSTDGLIDVLDLAMLTDDRQYFPPYDAVPIVRQETLDQHPEVREALGLLGGLISEEEMRQLNYRVDGERENVSVVVSEFLASKGL